MAKVPQKTNRYQAIIERVFFRHHKRGATEIVFERDELIEVANELKIELPKNLGDVVYSVRYRTPMPAKVAKTQTPGHEWIIDGVGRAQYAFRLSRISRVEPNPDLVTIKIPDSTPEIITAYALSDEQALLAKVRYNRLIDIFLGVTAYSLQSHLRTTVEAIGQIEIDEVYVGVDRTGRQFVIPVQAKGGLGPTLGRSSTSGHHLLCSEISRSHLPRDLSPIHARRNHSSLRAHAGKWLHKDFSRKPLPIGARQGNLS